MLFNSCPTPTRQPGRTVVSYLLYFLYIYYVNPSLEYFRPYLLCNITEGLQCFR